jgi:hypothetical protein
MKHTFITFSLGLLLAMSASAGTVIIGMEDNDTSSSDRDFQDLIASVTSASIQTGGIWSNLTPSVVNQSGTPFWDNPSQDGTNMNLGNFALGDGGFTGGPIAPGLQYLASPTGGMVSFSFAGAAIITVIGGITSDADVLGVCPDQNCNAGNTIWINGSLNYTPTGAWELTGINGLGAQWYSDPTAGQTSEFAALESVPTPEPATLALIGLGMLFLGWVRRPASRRAPRA